MPNLKYLHNPRCSKSREALKILNELDVAVEIIEYLKTPLTKLEIEQLFTKLQIDSPLEMMRTKEAEFKQAGLTKQSSTEDLINAMVAYPKLIERPILFNEKLAVIGRPPEKVKELVTQ